MKRDLKNNIDVVQSLHCAARTADANGTGVDLLGYESAAVVFHVGARTDGSFTPKVEESDNNSDYTAVAADDLEGSFTAITGSGQQNVAQRVGYKGNKRYIRAVIDQTASPAPSTGVVLGASVVRGNADGVPLA